MPRPQEAGLDYDDMVHRQFLPEDYTVNKEYHLELIQCLHETIPKRHMDFWQKNSLLLNHDNAPVKTSLLVRVFLTKNHYVIMSQPPHFIGFGPELKSPIKIFHD